MFWDEAAYYDYFQLCMIDAPAIAEEPATVSTEKVDENTETADVEDIDNLVDSTDTNPENIVTEEIEEQ